MPPASEVIRDQVGKVAYVYTDGSVIAPPGVLTVELFFWTDEGEIEVVETREVWAKEGELVEVDFSMAKKDD